MSFAEDLDGLMLVAERAPQGKPRATRQTMDLGGGRTRTIMTGDAALDELERRGIL